MHPEADAFLDAIFDHPDDDTHRLVYADWLEEHSQGNYAQFIRLQCAAAREKPWSDEANRLWEEIGRVWTKLDEEWWPATRVGWRVGRHAADDCADEYAADAALDAVHFERGFLRPTVQVEGNALTGCEMCWPWLPTPATRLCLWPNSDLEALAIVPTLRRVRRIRHCFDLDNPAFANYEPRGLDTLLRSPHLCGLRELDLTRCGIGPIQVRTLLTAPNLATVEVLRVWFNDYLWERPLLEDIPDRASAIRQLQCRFKHGAYWPDPE